MTSARRSIVALLVTSAALAGCSSTTPQPTQPLAAAATPAAATSSPAPAQLTKAQAAKIYLEAVGPVNKALTELNAALRSGDLKRIRAAAKACAETNRVFLAVLTDTRWPEGVQEHADKTSEVVAAHQSAYTALTTAQTPDEVGQATATISGDNSQAQLMRVKLGLGAVPST